MDAQRLAGRMVADNSLREAVQVSCSQFQTRLPTPEAPHSTPSVQQSHCRTRESRYFAVTAFGAVGCQVEPTFPSINSYLADSGRVKKKNSSAKSAGWRRRGATPTSAESKPAKRNNTPEDLPRRVQKKKQQICILTHTSMCFHRCIHNLQNGHILNIEPSGKRF